MAWELVDYDAAELAERIRYLAGCCLTETHHVQDCVKQVLCAFDDCPDGWDREGFVVFLLTDGRFAVLEDWADSSGHG